nr:Tn3 family transposase [Bacillus sp. 123MFChir2]
MKKDKGVLQEELFHHISPLGWEHINFLGEYKFKFKQPTTLESLHIFYFFVRYLLLLMYKSYQPVWLFSKRISH